MSKYKFIQNFKDYELDYKNHTSLCFDCKRPNTLENVDLIYCSSNTTSNILFKHKLVNGEIKIKDIEGRLHSKNDDDENFAYQGGVEKRWYCKGKLHRTKHKPAIVRKDGNNSYYLHGYQYDFDDNTNRLASSLRNINLREYDSNPRINDNGIINLEPFGDTPGMKDIFVFPVDETKKDTKCWWFFRSEIGMLWKNNLNNLHPLTRKKLSNTVQDRIRLFLLQK